MLRVCKICGKEFMVKTNAVCCSPECSSENKRQLNLGYEKSYKRVKRKKKLKEFKRVESITEIVAKAKVCGMSYGQYVGQMLLSEV